MIPRILLTLGLLAFLAAPGESLAAQAGVVDAQLSFILLSGHAQEVVLNIGGQPAPVSLTPRRATEPLHYQGPSDMPVYRSAPTPENARAVKLLGRASLPLGAQIVIFVRGETDDTWSAFAALLPAQGFGKGDAMLVNATDLPMAVNLAGHTVQIAATATRTFSGAPWKSNPTALDFAVQSTQGWLKAASLETAFPPELRTYLVLLPPRPQNPEAYQCAKIIESVRTPESDTPPQGPPGSRPRHGNDQRNGPPPRNN